MATYSGTHRHLLETVNEQPIYLLTYWHEYYASNGTLRITLNQAIEIPVGASFDTNETLNKTVKFTIYSNNLTVDGELHPLNESQEVATTGDMGDSYNEATGVYTGHIISPTEKTFLYGYDDYDGVDTTWIGDGITTGGFSGIPRSPIKINPTVTIGYEFPYKGQVIKNSFTVTLSNETSRSYITAVVSSVEISATPNYLLNHAPGFTYNHELAEEQIDSLAACVTDYEGNIVLDYRVVPYDNTNQFNFTRHTLEERKKYLENMPNSATEVFWYVLRTEVQGVFIYDRQPFTVRIVDGQLTMNEMLNNTAKFDGEPFNKYVTYIFSPQVDCLLRGKGTAEDFNPTGAIFQNFGSVYVYQPGEGCVTYGAHLSKVEVRNGGQAIVRSGGNWDDPFGWCPFPNGVTSNEFTIIVTDSRGFTHSYSYQIGAFYPHIPLTLDISIEKNNSKSLDVYTKGDYLNLSKATFAADELFSFYWGELPETFTNELVIQARIREVSSAIETTWGDWVPAYYIETNADGYYDEVVDDILGGTNRYRTDADPSFTIENYKVAYQIEVMAYDKFTTITRTSKAAVNPIFSWSYQDFEFNTDVVNFNSELKQYGNPIKFPEYGTWVPQCNNCTNPDSAYGNYLLFGDVCIVNFYFQGTLDPNVVPDGDIYLFFYGLPYTPDENIRWQSGGGTCQGYPKESSLAVFTGWSIEGGVIYGRTNAGSSTTTSGVHYDQGAKYIVVGGTGGGKVLYASGTIMYKISENQGGIVG